MTEKLHTITLQVRDEPGVLVRVAHVFARRGCNITSVNVEPHGDGVWSDMTISASAISDIDQIVRQLEKLVDVKSVRANDRAQKGAKW